MKRVFITPEHAYELLEVLHGVYKWLEKDAAFSHPNAKVRDAKTHVKLQIRKMNDVMRENTFDISGVSIASKEDDSNPERIGLSHVVDEAAEILKPLKFDGDAVQADASASDLLKSIQLLDLNRS